MQQWYGKIVSEALNTSYSILNLKMNLFRIRKPGVSFSNASFSGFIYICKISSSFGDALCEAHRTENRENSWADHLIIQCFWEAFRIPNYPSKISWD